MLFRNQSNMAAVKMANNIFKTFEKSSEAYIKSKSGDYFLICQVSNHYGRFQNGRR